MEDIGGPIESFVSLSSILKPEEEQPGGEQNNESDAGEHVDGGAEANHEEGIEENHKEEEEEEEEGEDDGDSGGGRAGLLDQLLPKLPPLALPDEQSPSADEASLLLTIIED